MTTMSDVFSINRRYNRSINLERDLANVDSVEGYVLTPRSLDALERILSAFSENAGNRAWTLTGAYGTGKSSFAHFLACLCAPPKSAARLAAEKIYKGVFKKASSLPKCLSDERGLVRAVATAQREPLEATVLRALHAGATTFWGDAKGRRPDVIDVVAKSLESARGGNVNASSVISLVKEVARAAKSGLLLVIDELGKNLEFASQQSKDGDLYLLQQLAELNSEGGAANVFVLGILHQSFAEYAQGVAAGQKNEWVKIQGRFEDIPFTGSTNEMVRLMANVIDVRKSANLTKSVDAWSNKWFSYVKPILATSFGDSSTLGSIYPIHPVAAAVLPVLCSRYGQNDRSLFTFLTSDEPHSLASFLSESEFDGKKLPTIKLDRVFDYWLDAAGGSLYSRPQLQRWVEVQGKVADASHLDKPALAVLKTIGILNLVSSSGNFESDQIARRKLHVRRSKRSCTIKILEQDSRQANRAKACRLQTSAR